MSTEMTLPTYHKTELGKVYLADSLDVMSSMNSSSVDLIMTSPPFGLTRERSMAINERMLI